MLNAGVIAAILQCLINKNLEKFCEKYDEK